MNICRVGYKTEYPTVKYVGDGGLHPSNLDPWHWDSAPCCSLTKPRKAGFSDALQSSDFQNVNHALIVIILNTFQCQQNWEKALVEKNMEDITKNSWYIIPVVAVSPAGIFMYAILMMLGIFKFLNLCRGAWTWYFSIKYTVMGIWGWRVRTMSTASAPPWWIRHELFSQGNRSSENVLMPGVWSTVVHISVYRKGCLLGMSAVASRQFKVKFVFLVSLFVLLQHHQPLTIRFRLSA